MWTWACEHSSCSLTRCVLALLARLAAGARLTEAATVQAGSNLGQRHLNAAIGRMRSGTGRDRFAEQCMEAARAAYGRADVTAAQDMMVVSVERL